MAKLSTDELIRHADAAAQLARSTGAGAIRLFDEELRARAVRRAELEDALHGAGERGEHAAERAIERAKVGGANALHLIGRETIEPLNGADHGPRII